MNASKQYLLGFGLIAGFILIVAYTGASLLPNFTRYTGNKLVVSNDSLLKSYLMDIHQWPDILPWLKDTNLYTFKIISDRELHWKNTDGVFAGKLTLFLRNNTVRVVLNQPQKSEICYDIHLHQKSSALVSLSWKGYCGPNQSLNKWKYFIQKDWLKKDIENVLQHFPDLLSAQNKLLFQTGKVQTHFVEKRYVYFREEIISDTLLKASVLKSWKTIRAELDKKQWKKRDSPYFCLHRTKGNHQFLLETGQPFYAPSSVDMNDKRVKILAADSIVYCTFSGNWEYLSEALQQLSASLPISPIGQTMISCTDTSVFRRDFNEKTQLLLNIYFSKNLYSSSVADALPSP